MYTPKTQEQLFAESIETARKLRNSLLRYMGMMFGSALSFYIVIGISDPHADMGALTVGSLSGYFAVALCILALTGLLGTVLNAYQLWNFVRVFRS